MTGQILLIRDAVEEDLPFLYGLAPRLAGAARLPWRDPAEVLDFQNGYMKAALEAPAAGAVTLVAVDDRGRRLGFLHAEPARDSIGEADCGYISLLAVEKEAEGRGIAQRLMEAAEVWARGKGFRFLSLEVFAGNDRAREFYDRCGYRAESLRMLKPV